MELKDTVTLMNSENYQDRFKAEYWQIKIRCEKLHRLIVQYEAGTLNFRASCPLDLLKKQQAAMNEYLNQLEIRAEIECIDLSAN